MTLKTYRFPFAIALSLLVVLLCNVACKQQVDAVPEQRAMAKDTIIEQAIAVPKEKTPIKNGLLSRLAIRPDCSYFLKAVENAPYFETLNMEQGPFSLFVPGAQLIKKLNQKDSSNWVGDYIIAGDYSSPVLHQLLSEFVPKVSLKTLSGNTLTFSKAEDTLLVIDKSRTISRLLFTDILGQNGVIHILKLSEPLQ